MHKIHLLFGGFPRHLGAVPFEWSKYASILNADQQFSYIFQCTSLWTGRKYKNTMIPKYNERYPQAVDKIAGRYVGRVRLIRLYIYMTRP